MSFEDMEDYFLEEPVNDCTHPDFTSNNGVNVCNTCFCEITILEHDAEWKNVRCHTKNPKKGDIKTVFTECKIPNGVVNKAMIERAEEKYKKIVKDDTARGDKRKGIVAACLYYVFSEMGQIKTMKDLENLFNLKRDKITDGMYEYHVAFPESRIQHVRPENLISELVKKVGITRQGVISEIMQISKNIENRNLIINRSAPQSVAPAVIFFYLCLNPEYKKSIGYTKKSFASKVELSEITLTRIVKKIAEIYEKNFGITNVDIS